MRSAPAAPCRYSGCQLGSGVRNPPARHLWSCEEDVTPIFTGRTGRDGRMHVYLTAGGRRYAVPRAGLARAVLAQYFGREFARSDLHRFHDFKRHVLAPLLELNEWTLTEEDVQEWAREYKAAPESVVRPRDAPAGPRSRATKTGSDAARDVREQIDVDWENGQVTRADLVYKTDSALLLKGKKPSGRTLPVGSLVRIHVRGGARSISGRIATYGQSDIYLVALGTRAVRRAPRYRVDLPVLVRSPLLAGAVAGRIVDLSSAGARVRGVDLPLEADVELQFVPPGQTQPVTMRAIVVRSLSDEAIPSVGVAFCMAALEIDPQAIPNPHGL